MANNIDETVLRDRPLPETWTCPHCRTRNEIGPAAQDIFVENFKYIQHCERCSYLHYWKLELTERFKTEVLEMLLEI